MSADPEKKDDWIHRVDTVPPPVGEGDAYNAPTKVGPLSADVIDAMRKAGVPEEMIPVSGVASASNDDSSLPRLYESAEDEPPTLLHASARYHVPVTGPVATMPAPAAQPEIPKPVDDTRLLVVAVFAAVVVGALAAFLTT